MASSINPPEELKHITPFLQRSQELATREPIVAYLCKYYAVKLAMENDTKSKEGKTYLLELMDSLEKEKKELGNTEAITNDVVGYAHVENFALKIFLNADNEDRAGKASRKTAKTFLAASLFLELLRIFGEIEGEIDEKIKYAKFKAADIMKALREGRTPTPGPPGQPPEDDIAFDPSQQQQQSQDTFGQPDGGFGGGRAPPRQFDDAFGGPSSSSIPDHQQPSSASLGEYTSTSAGAQQFGGSSTSPIFPMPPSQLPTYNNNTYSYNQPPYSNNMPPTSYNQPPQPGTNYDLSNQPQSLLGKPATNSGGTSYNYPPSAPAAAPTTDPWAQTAGSNRLSNISSTRPASAALNSAGGGSLADAFQLDHKATQNAQKMAKFAISALQYDDVTTAIENLEKALALLRPLQRP